MIENYSDHAANERTYLAWVRTALALLAFGLLVERFGLLAQSFSDLPESAPGLDPSVLSPVAGLGLILLGILVLAISSYRYLYFKRLISSQITRDFGTSRTDLMLIGVVALVGLAMTVYVAAQVVLF